MKLSNQPFLSWSKCPADDDFPCTLRFKENEFMFHYSVYNSWGGDDWTFKGTYEDNGTAIKLLFEMQYADGEFFQLKTSFTHETPYNFQGNQVELAISPISAFLKNAVAKPVKYYWTDFEPTVWSDEDT